MIINKNIFYFVDIKLKNDIIIILGFRTTNDID